MSEGDLLALALDGIDAIVALVSTAFGILSAYIAGLYFFLGRAPLLLRLAGFVMLSIALAFLGIMAFGIYGVVTGADVAWRDLPENATGVTSLGGERPPFLFGLKVYDFGAALGFGAFGLVYLALAYLTFFFRWSER